MTGKYDAPPQHSLPDRQDRAAAVVGTLVPLTGYHEFALPAAKPGHVWSIIAIGSRITHGCPAELAEREQLRLRVLVPIAGAYPRIDPDAHRSLLFPTATGPGGIHGDGSTEASRGGIAIPGPGQE